jgi:hypothetical protein
MLGFGKKGEEKKDVPTEKVRELASEGKNEKEIIEYLRRVGYSDDQINQALNRVLKFKVTGEISGGEDIPPPPRPRPQPSGERFIAPPPQPSPFTQMMARDIDTEFRESPVIDITEAEEIALEELIEEIISEKWGDVINQLEGFENRDVELNRRMESIERRISMIQQVQSEERKKLQDKIEETISLIENLESRTSSIEKAFKEFLPTLVENVRSLSTVASKLKSQTGVKELPEEPKKKSK